MRAGFNCDMSAEAPQIIRRNARGTLALTSEAARSRGKRGEWEPTEALAACLSTRDSC